MYIYIYIYTVATTSSRCAWAALCAAEKRRKKEEPAYSEPEK